jgi:hypothetical protein
VHFVRAAVQVHETFLAHAMPALHGTTRC